MMARDAGLPLDPRPSHYRVREQNIANGIAFAVRAVGRAQYYRDYLLRHHRDEMDLIDGARAEIVEPYVCAVIYHLQLTAEDLIFHTLNQILFNEDCDVVSMSAIDKTNELMKIEIFNSSMSWLGLANFAGEINTIYRACAGRFHKPFRNADVMLGQMQILVENLHRYAIRADLPVAIPSTPAHPQEIR